MTDPDAYLTLGSFSRGLYKEKGSRFISLAWPVAGKEEIRPLLESVRKEYHDARHHCYAWMLGRERSDSRVNDDGEPSGTAGKPILGQINSFGLTNILIIVVRYFGGQLLGTSGLINAYRSAAGAAIQNGQIIEQHIRDYYMINFPYTVLSEVMKVIKDLRIEHSEHNFDSNCTMTLNFRLSTEESVLKHLRSIRDMELRFIDRK